MSYIPGILRRDYSQKSAGGYIKMQASHTSIELLIATMANTVYTLKMANMQQFLD